MFPRISKTTKPYGTYEYLVISESEWKDGRSITRNIANLGNVKKIGKEEIKGLIDGLIRLFEIKEYALKDQLEVLETLEHGSILLWRAQWNKLRLSKIIKSLIKKKEKRIKLGIEKYVELMVINRCIKPLSKLGGSRWYESTSYKRMKGYNNLSMEVEYFYRSMDYLLKIKEELEKELYNMLRNLFSINVRMTFYDITSTFFYTENCELGAKGYSRDMRGDKEQIVIGVVTTYEGYPIKHYVFEGNRKDESTVGDVIKELKEEFNIEETTFVGDRGMISKLELEGLIKEEELKKLFSKKIEDKEKMNSNINRVFEGYKKQYKKFFRFYKNEDGIVVNYKLDEKMILSEEKRDGIFILTTNHEQKVLPAKKVVESYKNLREVEELFDDLKNFVDIHPIRHWLVPRVKSHVFLCILALLLKRIFEIDCIKSKSATIPLEEIAKVKLVINKIKFSHKSDEYQIIPTVTNISEFQKQIFKLAGVKNPMSIAEFTW